MPHPWLVGQFTQLGLDTYTHSFTLQYPMGHGKVRLGGWEGNEGMEEQGSEKQGKKRREKIESVRVTKKDKEWKKDY